MLEVQAAGGTQQEANHSALPPRTLCTLPVDSWLVWNVHRILIPNILVATRSKMPAKTPGNIVAAALLAEGMMQPSRKALLVTSVTCASGRLGLRLPRAWNI